MIRLIICAKLTQDYIKSFVKTPEDREPAVRQLVESAGARLVSFYFTTGENDMLLIAEASDAESILAAVMGAAARGAITNVSSMRAWTAAEFKIVGEKASAAVAAYRLPGEAGRFEV